MTYLVLSLLVIIGLFLLLMSFGAVGGGVGKNPPLSPEAIDAAKKCMEKL